MVSDLPAFLMHRNGAKVFNRSREKGSVFEKPPVIWNVRPQGLLVQVKVME